MNISYIQLFCFLLYFCVEAKSNWDHSFHDFIDKLYHYLWNVYLKVKDHTYSVTHPSACIVNVENQTFATFLLYSLSKFSKYYRYSLKNTSNFYKKLQYDLSSVR